MTSKPIHILIAGYYGYHNTGDEAILTSMLSGIRGPRPESEVTVLSYDPEWTSRTYSVNSISCLDVDLIRRGIQAADVVIIGGGGLFHDYWGVDPHLLLTQSHSGIIYYAGVGLLSSLYNKPLILYGVGVGPLLSEDGRNFTRALFDLATFTTVRDVYSRDVLDSIGQDTSQVRIVPDPAVGIHRTDGRRIKEILQQEGIIEKRPLLGVSLRNWKIGVSQETWEREVAASLDLFLTDQGGTALFIPFQKLEGELESDEASAGRVVRLMETSPRTAILKGRYSPGEIAGLIAYCDLFIGMRFHSILLSLMGEVPAVAIGYDPKVIDFMETIGCQEFLVEMGSLTRERVTASLKEAFRRSQETRSRFREAGAGMKSGHESHAKAVNEFLDSKRPSTLSGTSGQVILTGSFSGRIHSSEPGEGREGEGGRRKGSPPAAFNRGSLSAGSNEPDLTTGL